MKTKKQRLPMSHLVDINYEEDEESTKRTLKKFPILRGDTEKSRGLLARFPKIIRVAEALDDLAFIHNRTGDFECYGNLRVDSTDEYLDLLGKDNQGAVALYHHVSRVFGYDKRQEALAS